MKETLQLPKTTLPIKANLSLEAIRYKSWWDNKVYDRMKRNGENPFVLHDGPPYANGNIHIGHALNKILKDFVVKHQYFSGRAVEFVPGWDCHGLPIEAKVRLSGENTPDAIRNSCRTYAQEQINIQKEQFKALGVVADWDNPYLTMNPEFEQMIGDSLKELQEKGLLVRRRKPVYWSWAERTALAEAEVEYRDRTDDSIYVAFPSRRYRSPGGFRAGLLVWTTTPWTLPANVAVCVNPDMEYAPVRLEVNNEGFKLPFVYFFVAKNRVDDLVKKGIVSVYDGKTVKGSELVGLELLNPDNQVVPVVTDEYVSDKTGTGCVHIAPGHGEEDYRIGLKNNLSVVMPVGPDARYTEGKYKDQLIFHKENNYASNSNLMADLKANERLIFTEKISHSYPYSSRSDTPLIFRATEQWFLELNKVRESVLNAAETVEFVPENTKNRLMPMLRNRPDWCLSRQRVWGVPIFDGPDILDVWFDSGLTWRTLDRQADLYLEGNDQHRGWFQSSLWLSVALTGLPPYKKVVTHGFVTGPDGHKMSKSKGNVVDPNEVIKKYGSEVLRYWVASCDYTKEITISDEIMKRAAEGHRKLRNTLRFFLANLGEQEPRQDVELPIDKWILSQAYAVFKEVNQAFSNLEYYKGLHRLTEFLNGDLNGIYFSAVKDRLYCDPVDSDSRQAVVSTLATMLRPLLTLIAPLFTYTADEVFSHAPEWFKKDAKDIFDLTHEFDSKWDFPSSNDYWKEALSAFHVAFDGLKTEGKVKDPLEVVIETDVDLFERIEDWFGVSGVGKGSSEPLVKFEANGNEFRIVKSTKNKCIRCWKRKAENEVCERCQQFVKGEANESHS